MSMTPKERDERLARLRETIDHPDLYTPEYDDSQYVVGAINELTRAVLVVAEALLIVATPVAPPSGAFIVPERDDD